VWIEHAYDEDDNLVSTAQYTVLSSGEVERIWRNLFEYDARGNLVRKEARGTRDHLRGITIFDYACWGQPPGS
jgi:hypothetical protein